MEDSVAVLPNYMEGSAVGAAPPTIETMEQRERLLSENNTSSSKDSAKDIISDEEALAIRDMTMQFLENQQHKKMLFGIIVVIAAIIFIYFVYIIVRMNQPNLSGVWEREEGAKSVTLVHNKITGMINSTDGSVKADMTISGHVDFCKPFVALGRVEDNKIIVGVGNETWVRPK